jgi:hypothetical protein
MRLAPALALAASISGWLALAGCPAHGPRAVVRSQPTGAAADAYAAAVAEADALWPERADRAVLERAIARWAKAVELAPADYRTYEKLARATFFLADAHLRETDAAAALAVNERGLSFARAGLVAASPKLEKLLATDVPIADAAAEAPPEAAGLLFWYASHLASTIGSDRQRGMKLARTLEALAKRVLELAPATYYHGADRFLGAYYAALPGFLGGGLETSRRHFEAATAGDPDYLGNYLVMAIYYAIPAKDGALFDQLLATVIDAAPCASGAASPCVLDELAPEAAVDQRRAAKLREHRGELFE